MRLITPLAIHANMPRNYSNYRLRIPTGRRQTIWLCTSAAAELSQVQEPVKSSYGWPFVAKFSNVYLFATKQSILIQLQHRIFSFNDYIDSTSILDIFIQGLYSFNFRWAIFVQDKYLFNSSSSRTSINSYSTKLHLPTPLPPLL